MKVLTTIGLSEEVDFQTSELREKFGDEVNFQLYGTWVEVLFRNFRTRRRGR